MELSPWITVVSGLPRSGTSLMMQMLAAAGLEAVTDGQRGADVDNPRGYYEFEPVKKTRRDASWAPAARGKAVKVVSALLYDLPASERYRVVFMHRDMSEILASQAAMLERLGRTSAPSAQLRASFTAHLERLAEWLPHQTHLQVLELSYNELLRDPQPQIDRLAAFLPALPRPEGLRGAVDPSLYRNRESS